MATYQIETKNGTYHIDTQSVLDKAVPPETIKSPITDKAKSIGSSISSGIGSYLKKFISGQGLFNNTPAPATYGEAISKAPMQYYNNAKEALGIDPTTGKQDLSKLAMTAIGSVDAGASVAGGAKKLGKNAIADIKDAQLSKVASSLSKMEDVAHGMGTEVYAKYLDTMEAIDKFGTKVNPVIKQEAIRLKGLLEGKPALPSDPIPTLYHGTNTENAQSILKNGWDVSRNTKSGAESPYAMFTSKDIAANSDHNAGTYGKSILKITPKQGADIKVGDAKLWNDTFGKSMSVADSTKSADTLRGQGYDVVIDPAGEHIVLNPSKFDIAQHDPTVDFSKKPIDTAITHSVAMDNFVYHTTSPQALESIKKNGLKPSSGQYGKGVYFAPTIEETGGYGSAKGAMIRVNRSNLPKDFQEFPDQGWTPSTVPKESVEYSIDNGKTWNPVIRRKK